MTRHLAEVLRVWQRQSLTVHHELCECGGGGPAFLPREGGVQGVELHVVVCCGVLHAPNMHRRGGVGPSSSIPHVLLQQNLRQCRVGVRKRQSHAQGEVVQCQSAGSHRQPRRVCGGGVSWPRGHGGTPCPRSAACPVCGVGPHVCVTQVPRAQHVPGNQGQGPP